MSSYASGDHLLQQIEILREELVDAVKHNESFINERVVFISQRLDQLIYLVQRRCRIRA